MRDEYISFNWGIFSSILLHDEKKRGEKRSPFPGDRVLLNPLSPKRQVKV
jgi:hypothetical protein